MTTIDINQYLQYRSHLIRDFHELIIQYPFSTITFLPTVYPSPAILRVIAVHKKLIDEVMGTSSDFTGIYSKELFVEVPFDYQRNGCDLYGASWVDLHRIEEKDRHFFNECRKTRHGYKLCVGVPESFPLMNNVVLENVKTAENMLIAYERIMCGETSVLEDVKTYSHGTAGRLEFKKDKKRYIVK